MSRAVISVTLTDEELATQAQAGCAASFDELVRRFQVPLLQFLRRKGSADDAEDLVQETFVRIYRNLHRYQSKWRFATWAFTIAHRLKLNQRRRKRPFVDSDVLESARASTPGPEQLIADAESAKRLWDVAESVLSSQQHAAVWLYYVEDLSVKEVAQVLGRSQMMVKTVLFRARRRLSPFLESFAPHRAAASNGASPDSNSPPVTRAELANA